MIIIAIFSSCQALIVSSSLCNVVSLAMVCEETELQDVGLEGDSSVDMLRGKVCEGRYGCHGFHQYDEMFCLCWKR